MKLRHESTNQRTRETYSWYKQPGHCEKESTEQDHPVLENSKRVSSFSAGIINNRAVVTPTRKDSRPPVFLET